MIDPQIEFWKTATRTERQRADSERAEVERLCDDNERLRHALRTVRDAAPSWAMSDVRDIAARALAPASTPKQG